MSPEQRDVIRDVADHLGYLSLYPPARLRLSSRQLGALAVLFESVADTTCDCGIDEFAYSAARAYLEGHQ